MNVWIPDEAEEEAAKKRQQESLLGKCKAPEPEVQNLAQSKERLENFSTKLVENLENIQKTYVQEMNNSMQTVMKTVNEQMNIMQTAMKNAKERMNTVMNTVMENAKEEANAAVKNAKEGLQHVAQTSMAEVQDVTEEMRNLEKDQLERDKIDLNTPIEEQLVADAAKYDVTLTAKQLKTIGIVKLHDWFQKANFGKFKNVRKNRKKVKEAIFLNVYVYAGSKKEIFDSMKRELFPEKEVEEDYRIKYKDCVGKHISHKSWTGVITKITKCSIQFKLDGFDTIKTVRENFTIDVLTEAIDTVPSKKQKTMEWEGSSRERSKKILVYLK